MTIFFWPQGHKDAPQAKLTTAQAKLTTVQVMTVALVAAALFCGNQDRCHGFFVEHGYVKKRLSKSQFNRYLHEVPEVVWQALFALRAEVHKESKASQ